MFLAQFSFTLGVSCSRLDALVAGYVINLILMLRKLKQFRLRCVNYWIDIEIRASEAGEEVYQKIRKESEGMYHYSAGNGIPGRSKIIDHLVLYLCSVLHLQFTRRENPTFRGVKLVTFASRFVFFPAMCVTLASCLT